MGQQPCSGLALGDSVRRSRGWADLGLPQCVLQCLLLFPGCYSACYSACVSVPRAAGAISGVVQRAGAVRGCQNWGAISVPRRCLARFGKGPVHSHPPHFIIFLPADLTYLFHLLSSFKPFILVFVCVCVLYPASKPVILSFILLLPVCFLFVSSILASHSLSPFSASTPKQPNAKPPQ